MPATAQLDQTNNSLRPKRRFARAEQELLQVRIRQQQKNSKTDADTISSLKQQLSHMFPDQAKRDKAEKIIQSAKNRSRTRTNLSQKRPAARRKKQSIKKNNNNNKKIKINKNWTQSTLNLTNWQLSLMFFSESENKTRVVLYPGVSLTDSSHANPARRLVTGKSDI